MVPASRVPFYRRACILKVSIALLFLPSSQHDDTLCDGRSLNLGSLRGTYKFPESGPVDNYVQLSDCFSSFVHHKRCLQR